MTRLVDRAVEAHDERERIIAEGARAALEREAGDSLSFAKKFLGDEVGELDFEVLAKGEGVLITLETGHRVRAFWNGRSGEFEEKHVWLRRHHTFRKRIYVKAVNDIFQWPFRLRPRTYEVEVLSLAQLGGLIKDEVAEHDYRGEVYDDPGW